MTEGRRWILNQVQNDRGGCHCGESRNPDGLRVKPAMTETKKMTKSFSKKRKLVLLLGIVVALMFFSADFAKADDYYAKGTLLSTNLLDGLGDVAIIQSFDCAAAAQASTTVSVKFSQNGTDWFNQYGYRGWWDSCADGDTNIDLTALEWTSANFYYKLKFETASTTLTATVSEIKVNYSDEYTPPTLTDYYNQGFLVSTNLLAGLSGNLNGSEKFGYNISSLPAGTAAYAQFSQDGINWYSSTSTKWAFDTLSVGNHLEAGSAVDLSGLGWSGDSFYYKLKLITDIDSKQTPVIDEINLLRSATQVSAPQTNKLIVNAPLTNYLTDGLVGHWTFNGQDMDWASTTAEVLDRSGEANNGNVIGAKAAIGVSGQGLEFDGTDDYIDCEDVYDGVKTVAFWIKADNIASKKIIDINGTADIEVVSGAITANNFIGSVIYVDGVVASIIDTDWHYVVVVTDTAINANAVNIGRIDAGYFDGRLDEARIYNRALSADEVGELYRSQSKKFKIKR